MREKPAKPKRNASIRIGFGRLSRSLKLFIIISTVFALANFTYMFYILRAQDVLGVQLGIAIPIILYIIMNISETVFSIPAGMLSDKVGRVNVLLLGYGLFAINMIGFYVSSALLPLIGLFILYGITLSFIDATERALVSDLADSEYRATALGTYHTAIGLAALPSGIIAGFLWDAFSPGTTFLYGAVISMAAFLLLLASRIEE